jgi:hypothetical protein
VLSTVLILLGFAVLYGVPLGPVVVGMVGGAFVARLKRTLVFP